MGKAAQGHAFDRGTIEGIGINDYAEPIKSGTIERKAYQDWHSMFFRCYNRSHLSTHPSYVGCAVSDEWKRFSDFKAWFDENYVDGYVLDKDILSGKTSKVYSPSTCAYIPREINMLLVNRRKSRGQYPVGVVKFRNKFQASAKLGDNTVFKLFETQEEAFSFYKSIKENYIKEVAQKYYDRGEINERVYNALMKYEVEITD